MATIVRYKVDKKIYVMIGTGYGAYKATRPSFFGGNLFPSEESGVYPLAAITNPYGEIAWVETADLEVIEVDGKNIKEYFLKNNQNNQGT